MLLIASVSWAAPKPTESEQLVEDYVARANGNTELALDMMARDIILFTNDGIAMEHTIKVQEGTISVLKEREEAKRPGILERLSNSTVFKIGLFVGGVYLGREMVQVR